MAREVTLFIEDASIKLLVMKGKQIKKWAAMPLESGLVSDGVIVDEAEVANQLKELFNLVGVTSKNIVAGLSGLNSLYRLISLPELPDAMLDEAVRHEAGRVIPVSLDQVYLAYQPIPAPAVGRQVFLAAYPRNTTDNLLRTMDMAGLKVEVMDLAPLALCQTLNVPRAIAIDVRATNLDIAVMVDRVPEVIRSLALPPEAESLSEKIPTISEELNRTIAFYNSSHQEKPLDSTVPVLVSGELGLAPDSWPSLATNWGNTVSLLPSPVGIPDGFEPSEFMVNIGLGLKELQLEKEEADFSLVNLNTIPRVYKPKAQPISRILVPLGLVVGVGLAIALIYPVQNSMAETAKLRAELAAAVPLAPQLRNDISDLEKQIVQVQEQIPPLEAASQVFSSTSIDLRDVRLQTNEDLHQIVSLVPTNVDLTEIDHGSNSVIVKGIAPNDGPVFNYATSLRYTSPFSLVVVSSIQKETVEVDGDEEDRVKFELLLR